jgi:hypothetical protein
MVAAGIGSVTFTFISDRDTSNRPMLPKITRPGSPFFLRVSRQAEIVSKGVSGVRRSRYENSDAGYVAARDEVHRFRSQPLTAQRTTASGPP